MQETYYGHTAFFVWADRRNPGQGSSDIYMAVERDKARPSSLPGTTW